MIIIQVLGLDQFVVGRYSREHTPNLAQLYETDEKEIVFYSPSSMVFHKGVEQTSWQTLVIIRADEKYAPLEDAVADYIIKTLTLFSINVHIQFDYVHGHHCHEYVNDQYPRYLDMAESHEDEYSLSFGEEPEAMEGDVVEEECDHEHCHHHHEEEEIFLGDAFAGFEEKLQEAEKKNK